jgi:hypothetical protein
MKYFPNLTPEAANNKFRNWLKINPKLKKLISKKKHDFTPKQVKKIVDEVGEPFDIE